MGYESSMNALTTYEFTEYTEHVNPRTVDFQSCVFAYASLVLQLC